MTAGPAPAPDPHLADPAPGGRPPGPDVPAYRVRGSGPALTLALHGLGGSMETVRPFLTGVGGTRVVLDLPAHGRTPAPSDPVELTYPGLVAAVDRVLAAVAAPGVRPRALGVSLGAGVLLAGLAQRPDRYAQVVLVLPADLEGTHPPTVQAHFAAMARCVQDGDRDGLVGLLTEELPAALRSHAEATAWVAQRAVEMLASDVAWALRLLPAQASVPDPSLLSRVTVPVLLLAAEDDPMHPVGAARRLSQLLPAARLEVLGPGGLLWAHRRQVHELIAGFLSQPTAAHAGPRRLGP